VPQAPPFFCLRAIGSKKMLQRSKKRLHAASAKPILWTADRAEAHCLLGRFLPKLRRRRKRRRFFPRCAGFRDAPDGAVHL